MARARVSAWLFGLIMFLAATPATVWSTPPTSAGIRWHNDIRAAHKLAVQTGKPMLLLFRADWCGLCRKLETTTLGGTRMIRYVNTSFIPVHIDFDREKRIAEILDVKSLPSTVVLSPEADLLVKQVGYVDAEKYYKTLQDARKKQARIRQLRNTEPAVGR